MMTSDCFTVSNRMHTYAQTEILKVKSPTLSPSTTNTARILLVLLPKDRRTFSYNSIQEPRNTHENAL